MIQLQDIQIEALWWAIIGWFVKVVWDYYKYATILQKSKKKFSLGACWREYDQSWIMGLVGALALGLLTDWLYPLIADKVMLLFNIQGETPVYDVRVNLIIGFCAIYLIRRFTKNAKLEGE